MLWLVQFMQLNSNRKDDLTFYNIISYNMLFFSLLCQCQNLFYLLCQNQFSLICENALEFQTIPGTKPFVVQRGPYTYVEEKPRYNLTYIKQNSSVTYRKLDLFTLFVPEQSCAGCNPETGYSKTLILTLKLN